MKRFGGLKKISIRLNGSSELVYNTLAESVIGSKKILVAPGLMVHWFADGTIMELYGPGAEYPDYLFAESDTVVSYKVGNIDEAVKKLQEQGACIVTPIEQVHHTFRYCHVRVKGQSLFGIYEENSR